MNAFITALVVVANVTLAAFTLGRVVQRSERSKFRYRMWQLRDEVVDAVRDGEIEPHAVVKDWINRTELFIDATDVLTPFALVTTSTVLRRGGWEPKAPPHLNAPADVIEFLDAKTAEARAARMRLFLLGSPSGWLVSTAVPVVAAATLLTKRPRNSTPPTETVRVWSSGRFGSTSEVFRPLVEQQRSERRQPAYV
jgi:hypothetical protein